MLGTFMLGMGGFGWAIARSKIAADIAGYVLTRFDIAADKVTSEPNVRSGIQRVITLMREFARQAKVGDSLNPFETPILRLMLADKQCPNGYWEVNGFFAQDGDLIRTDQTAETSTKKGIKKPWPQKNLYARWYTRHAVLCAMSRTCGREGVTAIIPSDYVQEIFTKSDAHPCECRVLCFDNPECFLWSVEVKSLKCSLFGKTARTCSQEATPEAQKECISKDVATEANECSPSDAQCFVGGMKPQAEELEGLLAPPVGQCDTSCGGTWYLGSLWPKMKWNKILEPDPRKCGTNDCKAKPKGKNCAEFGAEYAEVVPYTYTLRAVSQCCVLRNCEMEIAPVTGVKVVDEPKNCFAGASGDSYFRRALGAEGNDILHGGFSTALTMSDSRNKLHYLCEEHSKTKPAMTGLVLVGKKDAKMKQAIDPDEKTFLQARCEALNGNSELSRSGTWTHQEIKLPSKLSLCVKTKTSSISGVSSIPQLGSTETQNHVDSLGAEKLSDVASSAKAFLEKLHTKQQRLQQVSLSSTRRKEEGEERKGEGGRSKEEGRKKEKQEAEGASGLVPSFDISVRLDHYIMARKAFWYKVLPPEVTDTREKELFTGQRKYVTSSVNLHGYGIANIEFGALGAAQFVGGGFYELDFTKMFTDTYDAEFVEKQNARIRKCEDCVRESTQGFCDMQRVIRAYDHSEYDICIALDSSDSAPGKSQASCESVYSADENKGKITGKWITTLAECRSAMMENLKEAYINTGGAEPAEDGSTAKKSASRRAFMRPYRPELPADWSWATDGTGATGTQVELNDGMPPMPEEDDAGSGGLQEPVD